MQTDSFLTEDVQLLIEKFQKSDTTYQQLAAALRIIGSLNGLTLI